MTPYKDLEKKREYQRMWKQNKNQSEDTEVKTVNEQEQQVESTPPMSALDTLKQQREDLEKEAEPYRQKQYEYNARMVEMRKQLGLIPAFGGPQDVGLTTERKIALEKEAKEIAPLIREYDAAVERYRRRIVEKDQEIAGTEQQIRNTHQLYKNWTGGQNYLLSIRNEKKWREEGEQLVRRAEQEKAKREQAAKSIYDDLLRLGGPDAVKDLLGKIENVAFVVQHVSN